MNTRLTFDSSLLSGRLFHVCFYDLRAGEACISGGLWGKPWEFWGQPGSVEGVAADLRRLRQFSRGIRAARREGRWMLSKNSQVSSKRAISISCQEAYTPGGTYKDPGLGRAPEWSGPPRFPRADRVSGLEDPLWPTGIYLGEEAARQVRQLEAQRPGDEGFWRQLNGFHYDSWTEKLFQVGVGLTGGVDGGEFGFAGL